MLGLPPAASPSLPPKEEPSNPVDTDPSTAGPRDSGPEEASPVRVLEDIGQDAGEEPAAVQYNLLLLLRVAAAVRSLNQLLYRLMATKQRH